MVLCSILHKVRNLSAWLKLQIIWSFWLQTPWNPIHLWRWQGPIYTQRSSCIIAIIMYHFGFIDVWSWFIPFNAGACQLQGPLWGLGGLDWFHAKLSTFNQFLARWHLFWSIIQSCFWIMISASGSKCVQSNWLFTSEGLPSIFDHASLSSSYHSVTSSGGSVASLWSHQEVSISLCELRPRLFTRLPMSWGCAVRDCQVLACFGSRPKGGNTMCTKQQVNYGRKEHRGKQL